MYHETVWAADNCANLEAQSGNGSSLKSTAPFTPSHEQVNLEDFIMDKSLLMSKEDEREICA